MKFDLYTHTLCFYHLPSSEITVIIVNDNRSVLPLFAFSESPVFSLECHNFSVHIYLSFA